MGLQQLIKDSGHKMEMVTSSFCTMVTSLEKKSKKEIMSPDAEMVKIPSGPSKNMRKIMKNKLAEGIRAPSFPSAEIIQSTAEASKDLV